MPDKWDDMEVEVVGHRGQGDCVDAAQGRICTGERVVVTDGDDFVGRTGIVKRLYRPPSAKMGFVAVRFAGPVGAVTREIRTVHLRPTDA